MALKYAILVMILHVLLWTNSTLVLVNEACAALTLEMCKPALVADIQRVCVSREAPCGLKRKHPMQNTSTNAVQAGQMIKADEQTRVYPTEANLELEIFLSDDTTAHRSSSTSYGAHL